MIKETARPAAQQGAESIELQPHFLGGGFTGDWRVLQRISPAGAKIVAGVLTVFIFALDGYWPGDLNASKFYACVLIVLAWTRSTRWLWGGAAVLAVLAIVGLTVGAPPVGKPAINWVDWTNRCNTVVMLIVTAGFVHVGVYLSRQLEASEQLLAAVTARERAEEALRERNARIRRLVDANIIGIVVWNAEGHILEVNGAFLRMMGYEHEDLVSGHVRWTDLTPPEWRKVDEQALRELSETGRAQPNEKEFVRKDGSRVSVMVGAATFKAGDKEGVAFVLDLTERKRAEEKVRESERRYREVQSELAHANRVATMGQLSASIAHEVNQPIAATITGAGAGLRWLSAQPPDVEQVRQVLNGILSDGNRAADVVGRVRALVKKAPPRTEPVDMNDVIREVIELTRGEAWKHGASVQAQLADDLPSIAGDRVQLQQVVLNLVINAFEAMDGVSDGVRELLISTATADSGYVTVAVRDSGSGFVADSAERLFAAFFSTKPTGLGMGLSICRSIVEAHGGRLWASENVPRGAIFQFTVPAPPDVSL